MARFDLDYPRGRERTKIGSYLDEMVKLRKGSNGLFLISLYLGIKSI